MGKARIILLGIFFIRSGITLLIENVLWNIGYASSHKGNVDIWMLILPSATIIPACLIVGIYLLVNAKNIGQKNRNNIQ